MSHYSFLNYWNTLRSAGRLQLSRSPATRLWRACIPELGVEVLACEMGELTAKLAPHIEKLPRTSEPRRVKGQP